MLKLKRRKKKLANTFGSEAVFAKDKDAREKILVIKHGALGDFFLALGPMAAIRKFHKDAYIILLTTKPFVALAEASKLFDEILVDKRPKAWQWGLWRGLREKMRRHAFTRVYDLQTSDRSSLYFKVIRDAPNGKRPEWSGIAKGCSHPDTNPERGVMHTLERQMEQLRLAGVPFSERPNLNFVKIDLQELRIRFGLKEKYALLVPGGSAHRPEKKWPAIAYAQLAEYLAELGIQVVLIGGAIDEKILNLIHKRCPKALNLGEATTLFDLAGLGQNALVAVGNDTGPMHVFALAGAPTLTLFSKESDPKRCAPRGPETDDLNMTIREDDLSTLSVKKVIQALTDLLTKRLS